jgi:VWFA-related protein
LRRAISVLLSTTLLIGHTAFLRAQISPTDPTPVAIDEAAGLLHLDVLATDRSGKPTPGLAAADFTLLDNGQPQKILTFQPSTDQQTPVEIILLLDTLKMHEPLAGQLRVGIDEFLHRNNGHLAHPVSIFTLSDVGVGRVAQSSTDGNQIAAELAHHRKVMVRRTLTTSGSLSRNKDAFLEPVMLTALKALGQIATGERQKPGRKLLLWIGPNAGIGSGAFPTDRHHDQTLLDTADWFSTLLRESRTTLYTLSVGEPEDPLPLSYQNFLEGAKSPHEVTWMNLYKKVLAIQSGGRVLESTGDLPDQIESCAQEADVFYTLTFDPSDATHPDDYHSLAVQLSQPDLTARTRTGYYDQPFYSTRPNPAVRLVTVEQLGQIVRPSPRELPELQLTERLDTTRLSALSVTLHGETPRQQLTALADASAFLDPPPTTSPASTPLDAHAQQDLIARASAYLDAAIQKLPNLLATRTTIRYEETPEDRQGDTKTDYKPLHRINADIATVIYRHGSEIVNSGGADLVKHKSKGQSLTINGVFGPLLSVAADILSDPRSLTWSRWEQGASGRVAVFRFTVPAKSLSYRVGGCCLPDGNGAQTFRVPSYERGEIELDPTAGALLRLQLEADLKSTTPLIHSGVMVEYGPVEVAGKTYLCPLRSISLSRVRSVKLFKLWEEGFRTYGPYTTLLNDMAFTDYHFFHAQSRILDGFTPVPPAQ